MGREILCWDIDGNSAGDTVVTLEVLLDFVGDRKTSSGTIFTWLLAEDNPVISRSLNKAGGHVRALQGTSFQNLLGISLLLGEMDSNFLGETGLDSPGEVLRCIGEVIPLNV